MACKIQNTNQDIQAFEHALAFHCGPAMAGIKAANLASFSKQKYPGICVLFDQYANSLRARGIQMDILCQCPKRLLILVYRTERLKEQLYHPLSQRLLQQAGYPIGAALPQLLEHLKSRLGSMEFPHEIGLFLGYPPEDVLGFQLHKGKNYKLCGHWKVYSDVERAKSCFRQYEQCRDAICRKLAEGKTLTQLFCAA